MRTPLNFVLRLVGHGCTAAVESTWGFTAVGGCSLGGVVMTATDTGTDGWPRTLVQESSPIYPHMAICHGIIRRAEPLSEGNEI